jgi:hypothetical protein
MRSARRCCKTVSSMIASVAKKIMLAITLICGGAATRAALHTNSGKVCVGPALKLVITKSSTDRAKVNSAPASTAGAINGRVTRMKV